MCIARGSERDALDVLVARGALNSDAAQEAVRLAEIWAAHPIDVVLAHRWALPEAVAEAVSQASGLDRLGDDVTLDPSYAANEDVSFFVEHQCLPWCEREGVPVIAAVNPFTAGPAIERALGHSKFTLVVATKPTLASAFARTFDGEVVDRAINELGRSKPEFSARSGIWPRQLLVFMSILAMIVAAFWYLPEQAFVLSSLLAGLFFIGVMLFRLVLTFAGLGAKPVHANSRAIDPARLPTYTVLVPLRDEALLLRHTVAALGALEYPATKLDIVLLLEEDDHATRAACERLDLDSRFTVLVVPSIRPFTKPKACNFGLAFTRGDLVALYDAEDRPDKDQLLIAAGVFDAHPEVDCLQSRLIFYNTRENWLTRQFAIEFASWFCFLLPGLERLGLPIPLGGTSNHFRRRVLEEAGGWDAFNVTEDADIGIRLARLGKTVRTLKSATAEEANCELGNWLHQRSRWLKGYLQTYLVHTRRPAELKRQLGAAGSLSFQLLIGGAVLAAVLHLVFWATLAARLLGAPLGVGTWPEFLTPWVVFVLIAGNGLAVLCALIASVHPQLRGQGRPELALNALSVPLYWFLISFAAVKALVSFASRPFYWAKTRHGISRLANFEPQRERQPMSRRSAQP